jgi:hypothetical protein
MLEGQVAALSSGAIAPAEAARRRGPVRERSLPPRPAQLHAVPGPQAARFSWRRTGSAPTRSPPCRFVARMLANGDERIVVRDAEGCYRFSAEFRNVGDLNAELDLLVAGLRRRDRGRAPRAGGALRVGVSPQGLYRPVGHHVRLRRAWARFTGTWWPSCCWPCRRTSSRRSSRARPGHMPAPGAAVLPRPRGHRLQQDARRVRRVSDRSLLAYAAACGRPPAGHDGAGQGRDPHRFGELGVRVEHGAVRFEPALLRRREFVADARPFRYLDVEGHWQHLEVPAGALAFTWCQVPILYRLDDDAPASLVIHPRRRQPSQPVGALSLPADGKRRAVPAQRQDPPARTDFPPDDCSPNRPLRSLHVESLPEKTSLAGIDVSALSWTSCRRCSGNPGRQNPRPEFSPYLEGQGRAPSCRSPDSPAAGHHPALGSLGPDLLLQGRQRAHAADRRRTG